ncbi:putative GATA transcription factor 22 [Rhododendron vialii]|uniref:putative GATA transcription factor 22 n=1 Tax=Rhododendron vialii TaxID=182163 RepID=UPI00265F51FC|nr:putative GATA transcription factor 22 [Rhododendron vialii]
MAPPVYLNSPPSPFPLIELKEDHHQQQQMQLFTSTGSGTPQHQASSSLSFPIFFNITQDQRASHDHFIEPKKGTHEYILDVGSSDIHRVPPPAYPIHPTVVSAKDNNGISSCKLEDESEDKRDYESSKWMMPKKIRIVQKMMNTAGSTHDQKKQERIIKIKFPDLEKDKCEIDSPSHGGNVLVRICSDCKTTKTPLWRSGPQGPKSLCNACGIRQRKARRAMLAAAAAAANSAVLTMENSTTRTELVPKKEKKSRSSYHVVPYKKPFGVTSPQGGRERISFEDFALSMSKSLGLRRAFPKDEEEAAILLMALSCGLLHD